MKKSISLYTLYTMSIIVLLAGCAKTPWYEGYYFDAKINNAKVVEIEDKDSLGNLKHFYKASYVHWMVKEKLHGELDVTVSNNHISHEFIGHVPTDDKPEVYIHALDGQNLNSTEKTHHSKDTYINSSAANKTDNVLTDNNLPAGAYVISIKTRGPNNWDRKYVYVEFE